MQDDQSKTRAARFLSALARSPHRSVQVVKSKSKPRSADRLIGAIVIGLPALITVANVIDSSPAQAQSVHPLLMDRINKNKAPHDNPFFDPASTEEKNQNFLSIEPMTPNNEFEKIMNGLTHPDIQTIVSCLEEASQDADISPMEQAFAAVQLRFDAGEILNEMIENADESMPLGVRIAAFCANPKDWRMEIDRWKQKAEKTSQIASQSFIQAQANDALIRYTSQQATRFHAIQYAADWQAQQALDPSLLHKTSGDWIRAATSIAEGLSQLSGSKQIQKDVRSARNTVQKGQRIGKRVDRIGQQKGARKWESIGNVMSDIGRSVDWGRSNRPRY